MRKLIYILTFVSLGSVLLTMLISCKKETQYKFIVTNNTSYRIDNIQFNCSVEETQISIEPNKSSSPFIINYKKKVGRFFTEPVLCVTITKYSDITTSYDNTFGSAFSISDFSQKATNSFQINLATNPNPPDIFEITKN